MHASSQYTSRRVPGMQHKHACESATPSAGGGRARATNSCGDRARARATKRSQAASSCALVGTAAASAVHASVGLKELQVSLYLPACLRLHAPHACIGPCAWLSCDESGPACAQAQPACCLAAASCGCQGLPRPSCQAASIYSRSRILGTREHVNNCALATGSLNSVETVFPGEHHAPSTHSRSPRQPLKELLLRPCSSAFR